MLSILVKIPTANSYKHVSAANNFVTFLISDILIKISVAVHFCGLGSWWRSCTMERFGEYVKRSVLNFKLQQCCWVASVRTGAVTLACVNLILGLTMLVVLSEGDEASFDPLFKLALEETSDMEDGAPDFVPYCIIAYAVEIASNALVICAMWRLTMLVVLSEGDEASFDPLFKLALEETSDMEDGAPDFVPYCIIAYAVEIASNALVICAMWRNDIVLLRAYLYYALGVLTGAVMVYSVVFMALTVVPELFIVASLATQLYQIMLVRSAMVEIKNESTKNGYTINLKPNESGSGEKYSVTIDPEKPKLPPKPVTKEDISKPVIKEVREATVTVHSPAKEAFLRNDSEEAKEVAVKPSRHFVREANIDRAKPAKVEVARKV